MGRLFTGKHLYNQIAVPLVLAALVVGIAATVVATYFLADLTDRWIDQVAENATGGLETRLADRSNTMLTIADLTVRDPALVTSIEAGDIGALEAVLEDTRETHRFAHVMVLDGEGRVVAASGVTGLAMGERPWGDDERGPPDLARPSASFVSLGGRPTLTVAHPIDTPASAVLCLSLLVDNALLEELTTGTGSSFALYASDGHMVALSVSPDPEEPSAGEALTAQLDTDPQLVSGLLVSAARDPSGQATSVIDVGGHSYTARAARLDLDDVTEPPAGAYHVVAMISQRVSGEAREGTMNLIAMWSFIAVIALVGLGGWVARRVSVPLVALTEGARKVAEGDFSAKMEVGGDNEIGQLAKSFNQMTDSLRDRSETLTRLVLELATLYEMSRSLGSTLDMDELLESVLDFALRIFDADLGYITMRDPETAVPEVRAYVGAGNVRLDDTAVRNSMSEWVIRESRPLIFNPTDGTGGGQVEVVTGALAALCVPLVSSEGTVGAITVGSQDPDHRFDAEDVRLLSTIANHVTIAIGNIDLFSSLQEAYLATVRSLAAAVDAKDTYTRGHSEGVAVYAAMIAEKLDLAHDQRVALEMAAYLHDIGKIGIKEDILLKPGTLTDAEMGQMRHHPLIGANILRPVAFPWAITPVVRHHHEFWDGNGYPAGLRGEEIPLLARILTVADAYEAMISDRPYRKGRTGAEGIAELRRCAGTQFDPVVVDALVTVLDERERMGCEEVEGQAEHIGIDEARAIFVALSEGMFVSFRKLGGPRLAGNVEREVNERFSAEGLPMTVSAGRVAVTASGNGDGDSEVEALRVALRIIDQTMGRMSGHTLVEHFYADSIAVLPDRMKCMARRLEFYAG